MNAFYVIVSIPILLVLAGFNHAHGLTTFGKSQTQNQSPTTMSSAKVCKDQSYCALNKNTTCLRGMCLCGDNHPPNNGECTSTLGPNHICTKSEDCVDNADCIPIKDVAPSKDIQHLISMSNISICKCQEGYAEIGATCGGGTNLGTIPFLLVAVTIYKIFN